MELKYEKSKAEEKQKLCSNRTFMELKLKGSDYEHAQ